MKLEPVYWRVCNAKNVHVIPHLNSTKFKKEKEKKDTSKAFGIRHMIFSHAKMNDLFQMNSEWV